MESRDKPKPSPDYLMQLMNDRKLMSSLPNFCGIFHHLERLLDEGTHAPLVWQDAHSQRPLWSRRRPGQVVLVTSPLTILLLYSTHSYLLLSSSLLSLSSLSCLLIPPQQLFLSSLTTAGLAFSLAASAQAPRIITGPSPLLQQGGLRTPTPGGPALMPLIRQIQTVMPNGSPHPGGATLVPQGPEAGLIYASPYDYPYALAPAASIVEYPLDSGGVLGKHLQPCSCECSPTPHHHHHHQLHAQWNPTPTLLLRHTS
ncbi:unnamed protein product [Lota lota]